MPDVITSSDFDKYDWLLISKTEVSDKKKEENFKQVGFKEKKRI